MATVNLNDEVTDMEIPFETEVSRFVRAFSGLLVITLGWIFFANLMISG